MFSARFLVADVLARSDHDAFAGIGTPAVVGPTGDALGDCSLLPEIAAEVA